jgi:hypothetical protein
LLPIEFAATPTACALREGGWQALFDKALAGAMDGRDPDTQSFSDLFIGSIFRRLEQDVCPCYLAHRGFTFLKQIKQVLLFGVTQINKIFVAHVFLQVWPPPSLEESLPVKISVVIY